MRRASTKPVSRAVAVRPAPENGVATDFSRQVGQRSPIGSIRFDADAIIHCVAEPLLAAEIPLSRLNAHMTRQELNLLQLATGLVTQARARSAEVVRRNAGHTAFRTSALDDAQMTFGLNPLLAIRPALFTARKIVPEPTFAAVIHDATPPPPMPVSESCGYDLPCRPYQRKPSVPLAVADGRALLSRVQPGAVRIRAGRRSWRSRAYPGPCRDQRRRGAVCPVRSSTSCRGARHAFSPLLPDGPRQPDPDSATRRPRLRKPICEPPQVED